MSLIGTLKDLSLFNLVQLHCCERQQAQVSLAHGDCDGRLVFADGELVFAAVGGLVGGEAVHELLTWEDGDSASTTSLRPSCGTSGPHGASCSSKGSGGWMRRAPRGMRAWKPPCGA